MRYVTLRNLVVGVAMTGAFAASPALAQDEVNLEERTGPGEPGVLDQLHLADNLFAIAVEDGDPILAIAAARLAAGVPVEEVERTPESEPLEPAEPPEGADTAAVESGDGALPELDTILATARELARGDAVLLAMIEDIEATRTRGRVGGPGFDRDIARARTNHYYTGRDATFRGGYPAEVAIGGSGYTDLDLYVFDQYGNLVCSSRSRSDREYCRWQPRWTGPFRVEVRNLGWRDNPYVLRTN